MPSSGWTPTYYHIWRSTSANGTYTEIGTVFGSTISYTNTGLNASTTYYYTVEAENSIGRSPQSSYVSATTQSSGGIDNLGDTRQEGVYIGIISFAGTANDLTGGVPVLLDAAGKNSLTDKLNSDYTISSQGETALFYVIVTK
jgi:hypothetical protein